MAVAMMAFSAGAFAQEAAADASSVPATKKELRAQKKSAFVENLKSHVEVHGFIRNYFAFDTRQSVSGTGDLFYYVPKDENWNTADLNDPTRTDLNAQPQFRFLALTTRLWVDVNGYQIQNTTIGAKVEADFYTGLSGVTGTAQFRLRQAYVTLGWEQLKAKETLKIGQAWHPMAADMPDVFSLNTGAPFGPFSRTPLAQLDATFGEHFGLTAAAIWQQQYPSSGPSDKSADYIKYGCTPEFYVGINAMAGGFLMRAGLDVLSIKPRINGTIDTVDGNGDPISQTVKVNDRITTMTPFLYMQYKTKFNDKLPFSVKAKTVFAQAGEHVCLNGGYGVTKANPDGSWEYAPTRNSSTWFSLALGQKFQGVLFAGYVKNFGTAKPLVDDKTLYPSRSAAPEGYSSSLYFSGNSFSNMNQMFRVTPTLMYNLGKFTFGLEYELTGIQYGSFKKYKVGNDTYSCVKSANGLATEGLHWVNNHRVQAMVKFTF